MSPRTPAQHVSPRAPREHGFWVLLGISEGAALLFSPTLASLAAACGTAIVTIGGAALVGKRIRKNPPLQALASVLIAATTVPVVLAGEGSVADAAHLSIPLGLAYLSGTFCVRAILERARKAQKNSLIAGLLSIALPCLTATLLYLVVSPLAATALAVTAIYTGLVFSVAPSAKKLKAIGMSISVAHALTATILLL